MLDDTLIQRDPNTGLLQRLDFEYKIYQLLMNASPESPVSLLRISYDLEKISVEDKLKLSFDRNLRRIADSMKRISKSDHVLGKIGKAEFGVVACLDEKEANNYAQRMCDGIAEELQSTTNVKKTVSVGVITTDVFLGLDSALNESHRCMIAAKALGGGQVCTMSMLHQRAVDSGMPLNLLSMEYQIRVQAEQTASDIAFRTRSTIQNLMEKAETDPLTGLNNRGYFDKRMPREISDAHQKSRPLSYAIIDADNFGNLNKLHSLPTGDAALRIIADVLRQETRSNDWVARYGGEEFAIIMPDTRLEDGVNVVNRIKKAIASKSVQGKNDAMVSLSVCAGVVQLTEQDKQVDDLTNRASPVLKLAKSQPRKNSLAYQDLSKSSEPRLIEEDCDSE
jgi:two-component system cell cycle response regulator